MSEVQQRINQAQQDKLAADQRAANHDASANNLQNEVSPLLIEAQGLKTEFENLARGGALNPSGHPALYHRALAINGEASRKKRAADEKQTEANRAREAAAQERNLANEASKRLEQIQQEKIKAEAHLNAVRQQVATDKKCKRRLMRLKMQLNLLLIFIKS
ncbi:TPA: hypothetical protein PXP51_001774 [Yersinia enterocolitica]|nr:hypothetical protein [Yersinia enterocolitica]